MPVTLVGIVYYADDPEKKVFRLVLPEFDDAELDQPPTDGMRRIIRDKRGRPYKWTTYCVDPARRAIMEKVPLGDSRAVLTGVP